MVVAARQLQLRLPDGRDLEVLTDGPTGGLPLIFHYGTPCAAVLFRPLVAEATQRKLRTIVYSRPGYATSTAKPGRSLADAIADVQATLGDLDLHEFVTIDCAPVRAHPL